MKYLSSTYLKDIDQYIYSFDYNKEKSECITVKKIISIKEPFILNEDGEYIKIIDNNYYILEYMPFNDNYVCRVHLDQNGNTIERFFITTLNNHLENGIPAFTDLKLSYVCTGKNKKIYNKDVIDDMVNKKVISKEEYDKAIKIIKRIEKEIDNNSNYIYNEDYKKYLF